VLIEVKEREPVRPSPLVSVGSVALTPQEPQGTGGAPAHAQGAQIGGGAGTEVEEVAVPALGEVAVCEHHDPVKHPPAAMFGGHDEIGGAQRRERLRRPADPTGDPLYGDQWHLTMIGDLQTIWQEYSGAGVSVGVYDNGIEYTHPDLAANYDASKHVIVDGQALDPSPSGIVTAEHGTAVSGVIAAVDNDVGGVGVAFGASITGVNIFGGPADINGADISGFSQAIYQAWTFDIINNSWGATPDFNNETNAAMLAAFAGFETAVQTGRGGLGTIVVKAAGNDWDSSQGDFLNASRYTITVAAHDQGGDASWYTNRGANVLVSAPSSGSSADGDAGILTTDETGSEGYAAGNYTYGFGGTSSATPVVAGVVALMLDANPNLGWRDVQSILAYSATKIAADKLAESYFLSFDLPVVILRPFNTFGPRQSLRAVIPSLMAQALYADEIVVGTLEPVRDTNYVADTVAAFLAVAEADGVEGNAYNVGSGRGHSIGEILERVQEVAGVSKAVRRDEARMRPARSEVGKLICDYSRAAAAFRYAPATSLVQGLECLRDYLLVHQPADDPNRYKV